jgi:hypothetical protein
LHILRSRDAFNNPIYEAEYAGYDEGDPNDPNDDSYLYYIRFYDLKDTLDVDASEGELQLYNGDLEQTYSWDVADLECLVEGHAECDGLHATSTGIMHELLVPVPLAEMQDGGTYRFVLSMKDDHLDKYRDHRKRWARDLNAVVDVYNIEWIKITYANGTSYPNGFTGDEIYVTRNVGTPPTSLPPLLIVKAKISPAKAGLHVWWNFTDPDEPAGHVPDDTDTVGNDNHGTGAGFSFAPFYSPIQNLVSTTDVNGETEVYFNATTYGGDNFNLWAFPYEGLNSIGNYKVTQTVTVWKQIVFEIEDNLEDYAYDPSSIAHELRQVYVEREETYGTGDIIPANDSRLWDGGAYGPIYEDIDDLAQVYDDDPNTDYQIIITRASNQASNYLREHEPYSSTTDYEHWDAPSGAMDWGKRNDQNTDKHELAPEENGPLSWARMESLGQPFLIFMYKDEVSADALCLGVTSVDDLKKMLWHETGHMLGLVHNDADGVHSIMNQTPYYGGQADLDLGRDRVNDMHWSDYEGSKVRQSYVPNSW